MTEDKLNNKIKQAFVNATPDLKDAILCEATKQKGKVIYMETKKNKANVMKRITSIAAALVLLAVGAAGYGAYSNLSVDSVIALDVNPSIELEVNAKERVIAVNPLNEDAKIVVGDMDFKGSDVDVAVNALIGSMLRNGYINDMANSILLSVNNEDKAKGEALQARLTEEIDSLLNTQSFQGAVLSQSITATDEIITLAQQHGITEGKASYVQQIATQNTTHTFDELANLSINELNLLSSGSGLENVSSTGSASDKAYVGEAKAKAAALAHAGVSEADITRYEWDMDYERGTMVYEIEFHHNGREYDYDVEASTGEVLWSSSEWDDDYYPQQKPAQEQPAQQPAQEQPAQQPKPEAKPEAKPESKPADTGSYIGEDKAKAAALAHAGLSESQVNRLRCERDREDGRMVYEVDFKSGGMEYEYEIDATTGKVLKYDKEYDD